MELQEGSIVSMTTAEHGWFAAFEHDGEKWSLPVVAWAVVVVKREEYNGTKTGAEAVVVDDEGRVLTLEDYCNTHKVSDWNLRRMAVPRGRRS